MTRKAWPNAAPSVAAHENMETPIKKAMEAKAAKRGGMAKKKGKAVC